MQTLHIDIADVLFVTVSTRTLLVLCPNSRAPTLSMAYRQRVALQVREASLQEAYEVHERLVSERKAAEDAYYAFATKECGTDADVAQSDIAQARLEPHKNARLQSIHETHQAVLSIEAEIARAESDLTAYKRQSNNDKQAMLGPERDTDHTAISATDHGDQDEDSTTMDLVCALPGAPAALVRQCE